MFRVRFAPSPTGFLHIGGLRTALYNELFALRHGGVFVLRIEDTDRARLVDGAVENLLRTLDWAGVHPTEGPYLDENGSIKERGAHGPYVQSARLDLYQAHADKLLTSKNAYRCFCTAERLEEVKKGQAAAKMPMMYDRHCRAFSDTDVAALMAQGLPSVIRLRIPEEGTTSFDDAIRGAVSFENALVDDQVLMKSDGFPTYHLANVVDDHLMEISHVIRGEEWLPSTPKHMLLYRAFGWEPPIFAHLPLLLNADRSKLSKRQGDVAVEDYKNKGYLPEAIVNFVALLGWNPTADREVYAKAELAAQFTLEKINKSGAVFNTEKLLWLNREYVKEMSAKELAAIAAPFYAAQGISVTPALLEKAVVLEQRRVSTLAEFPEATAFLFTETLTYDAALLIAKKSTKEIARTRLEGLKIFFSELAGEVYDDAKTLEGETLAYIVSQGWTNSESLWPLRVALTGRAASPGPFEVAWALGKERTLEQIDSALRALA